MLVRVAASLRATLPDLPNPVVKTLPLHPKRRRTAATKLSSRLWRRYGDTAFLLLEQIRENPEQAEVLIQGTEYIRCELHEAAHREMITKLEDFLRRRSKIALVERNETIRNSPGLKEACQILFGDQAEAKMTEYFESHA